MGCAQLITYFLVNDALNSPTFPAFNNCVGFSPVCLTGNVVSGVAKGVEHVGGVVVKKVGGTVVKKVAGAAQGMLEDVLRNAFTAIGKFFLDGFKAGLELIGNFLSADEPILSNIGDKGVGIPTVETIRGTMMSVATGLFVIGVIISAGKMMLDAHNGRRIANNLLYDIFHMVLWSFSGTAIFAVVNELIGYYSNYVINTAGGKGHFAEGLQGIVGFGAIESGPILGSAMIILVGLIGVLFTVIQCILLIFRSGVVFVTFCFIPLSCSLVGTDTARTYSRKVISFCLAFLLYKPVAATILALGMAVMNVTHYNGDGIMQFITGVSIIITSVFALPALVKLLTPDGIAGGGNSGAGAGMAIGAAAMSALPTGARHFMSNSEGGSETSAGAGSGKVSGSGANASGGGSSGGPGGGSGGAMPGIGGGSGGGSGGAGGAMPGIGGASGGGSGGAGGAMSSIGGGSGSAGSAAGAASTAGMAAGGAATGGALLAVKVAKDGAEKVEQVARGAANNAIDPNGSGAQR